MKKEQWKQNKAQKRTKNCERYTIQKQNKTKQNKCFTSSLKNTKIQNRN